MTVEGPWKRYSQSPGGGQLEAPNRRQQIVALLGTRWIALRFNIRACYGADHQPPSQAVSPRQGYLMDKVGGEPGALGTSAGQGFEPIRYFVSSFPLSCGVATSIGQPASK